MQVLHSSLIKLNIKTHLIHAARIDRTEALLACQDLPHLISEVVTALAETQRALTHCLTRARKEAMKAMARHWQARYRACA